MSKALLEIENLSVSYRGEDGSEYLAASGVSLSLDRGESLCIVGESGSGKSSVAMSVPRLLPSPPAFWPEGKILFDGEDILSMSSERLRSVRGKRIGVVFQDPIGSLSPLHRIGEHLVETLLLHSDISRAAARAASLEYLERVGIPEPLERFRAYPHELSGGMQQRVMIAMALILGPDLIIADEPTTALDVTVQAQILSLMRSLVGKSSALLLITHDLGVVARMATKLAVMKDGKVIESSDDVVSFFTNPVHPHSRALVAEARKMELR
jgi:ABC-type microcin C transport system duplicated ATPase subunit YejF